MMEKAHVSHPNWPTPVRERNRKAFFRQKPPQCLLKQTNTRSDQKQAEAEEYKPPYPQVKLGFRRSCRSLSYPEFCKFCKAKERVFVLSYGLSVFQAYGRLVCIDDAQYADKKARDKAENVNRP